MSTFIISKAIFWIKKLSEFKSDYVKLIEKRQQDMCKVFVFYSWSCDLRPECFDYFRKMNSKIPTTDEKEFKYLKAYQRPLTAFINKYSCTESLAKSSTYRKDGIMPDGTTTRISFTDGNLNKRVFFSWFQN